MRSATAFKGLVKKMETFSNSRKELQDLWHSQQLSSSFPIYHFPAICARDDIEANVGNMADDLKD